MDEALSIFRPSSETAYWSVSELNARVKASLAADFDDVAIRGEVSGVSRPRSGHIYFKLKDDKAQVSAVLWKGVAGKLVFDLEDGLAVKVRGEATLYETRGDFQIVVRKIEPEGVGPLELAFRQLFERLSAQGLFDPARKRTLPKFPKRLALITSPTGAAVQDFLRVAGVRWPATEILVIPVRVQGQGSSREIAEAVALANRIANVDVIVLARGGGSLEDLWSFNEEIVARAIFESRAPVVCGVGHEVDVTIADLVADIRALTPTDAANRCLPDAREYSEKVLFLRDRLARALQGRLDLAAQTLAGLGDRARRAIKRDFERRIARLDRVSGRLEALSPLAVLARGYCIVLSADGSTVVRSARDLQVGDVIHTRLVDGQVASRVETLEIQG